jgi:hypothetical protein
VVNRAALTGCTGRDHESNKNPESDVRGARPEGIIPNEQSELVTKGDKPYCTREIYIRSSALYLDIACLPACLPAYLRTAGEY